MKLTLTASLSLATFLTSIATQALECKPLEPTKPTDAETVVTGNLDATIDGAFRRIANLSVSGKGGFTEIERDVLQQYPNADRVHIWDRFIYLKCTSLNSASELTDQQKQDELERLFDRYEKDAPGSGATPVDQKPLSVPVPKPTSSRDFSPNWIDGGFFGISGPEDFPAIKKKADTATDECAKCLRYNDKTTDPETHAPVQTGYLVVEASRCTDGVHLIMNSLPYTPPTGPTPPGIIGMITTKLQWASLDVYPGERVRVLTHDIVNITVTPQACLTADR